MNWRNAFVVAAIGCAVLGWLWWSGRGDDQSAEIERALHRADSSDAAALNWKSIAFDNRDVADSLREAAEDLVKQDSTVQNWYQHERQSLPSADAARIKRIITWRNPRSE